MVQVFIDSEYNPKDSGPADNSVVHKYKHDTIVLSHNVWLHDTIVLSHNVWYSLHIYDIYIMYWAFDKKLKPCCCNSCSHSQTKKVCVLLYFMYL